MWDTKQHNQISILSGLSATIYLSLCYVPDKLTFLLLTYDVLFYQGFGTCFAVP